MSLSFLPIDLSQDFPICLKFRRDAYFCSFGTLLGFEGMVGEQGAYYRQKILSRQGMDEWAYIHVLLKGEIIGQLELKGYSELNHFGYIHLIYLRPELRGRGFADQIHSYCVSRLKKMNCRGALLSVGEKNLRALSFYRKHGWQDYGVNPKSAFTRFRILEFDCNT